MTVKKIVEKYIDSLKKYIPPTIPPEKRGSFKGIPEEKKGTSIYLREDCILDLPTLGAVANVYEKTKSIKETHKIISERHKWMSIEDIKYYIEYYEENKEKTKN